MKSNWGNLLVDHQMQMLSSSSQNLTYLSLISSPTLRCLLKSLLIKLWDLRYRIINDSDLIILAFDRLS
jgi:hypothetical protein